MAITDYEMIPGYPNARIRANADGSFDRLWDDGRIERVVLLPCECGCGRIVEGGMMEAAHPEDYRYDERA
jgi:hypothetical protein